MKKQFIVVDIGCIECGSGSHIVGVFDNEELANKVAAQCQTHHNWHDGGDHYFEVFLKPKTNIINSLYTEVKI